MAWGEVLATLDPAAAARPASLSGSGSTPRLRGASEGPLATSPPTPRIRPTGGTDPVLPAGGAPDAAVVPDPSLRPGARTERRPRIIPAGARNFAGDFAAGMVTGDSSAPPLVAFGQGLYGALKSERDRTEAERSAALDAEKFRYQRERDEAADARADEELQIKRDTLEAQRAGEGYWKRDKPGQTEYVDEDGNLTAKGRVEIASMVQDERKSLIDFYQETGRGKPEDRLADIDRRIQQYQQDLVETVLGGGLPLSVPRPVDGAAKEMYPGIGGSDEIISGGGDGDTPPPGGEAAPLPKAPNGLTGNGTEAQPYVGFATPQAVNAALANQTIKSGEFYKTPDGNTYQAP